MTQVQIKISLINLMDGFALIEESTFLEGWERPL